MFFDLVIKAKASRLKPLLQKHTPLGDGFFRDAFGLLIRAKASRLKPLLQVKADTGHGNARLPSHC